LSSLGHADALHIGLPVSAVRSHAGDFSLRLDSLTKRASQLRHGPIEGGRNIQHLLDAGKPQGLSWISSRNSKEEGEPVLKRKSLLVAVALVVASLVGLWCAKRDPTEVVVTIAFERAPVLHLVPGQKFETVSVDPQGRIWVISRPMEPDEEPAEPFLIDLPPAKDGTVRHLIILEYPWEAPEHLLPAKGI
jgi:hypothetical protein